MKSLILHCPSPERAENDAVRFALMRSVLLKAGIEAAYSPVHSLEQCSSLLLNERPDIVFCTGHHLRMGSEQANLHAHFEKLGIPYIGSSPETLDLVLSKSALKAKWRENGVTTPGSFLVRKEGENAPDWNILDKADKFPYILKPDLEGNSRGLSADSIVFDRSSLLTRLNELLQSFPEVLVEEFLGQAPDIREFTVAMIGSGEDILLMPARITLKQKKALRIITTLDKDDHQTQADPVIELDLKHRLEGFAKRAFEVAGVRDYARCDILMTGDQLYAIEINGQPMVPDKWFEMAASGAGLNSEQYMAAIFLAGIERNIRKGVGHLSLPEKMENFLPEEIFKQLTRNQIAFNEGISLINLTGQY